MYHYNEQRKKIFTDEGQKDFLKIRDNAKRMIESSGAATMGAIIKCLTGDSWFMLACVDRLVELGELTEVKQEGRYSAQDRVFKLSS